MDSTVHRPSSSRIAPLAWWLVAAVAALYAWLIYKHGSPFAAGSDSSGYLNSARLLSAGQFTVAPREIPGYPPPWRYYSHMPLGFVVSGPDRMAPTYPVGLPLHLAAFAPIVGWEKTARAVNVVNVLVAGVLLFALGRQLGLGRTAALTAVAALWLSPVWRLFAIQPMSDPVAATWTLATLLCAWLGRTRWAWGFAAGAALGIAVLVRPANLIVALPVAIALGSNVRAWLACGVGGIPFAAFMLYYNVRTYGEALTTGYGFVGDAFTWGNVPHNLAHFALWLPLLTGAPLALAALGLPWIARRDPAVSTRAVWLLAIWLLTFLGFYVSYWFAGETWWYLRFLLPAFSALILAGTLAAQQLAARTRHLRWMIGSCVLAGLVSEHVLAENLINYSVRDGERRYQRACAWLNQNLPPEAIVASCQLSGAQFYYTRFPLLRWDQLPRDEMEKIMRGLIAARRPLYAALFGFEEERAWKEHLPGEWQKIQEVEQVSIWRWIEPAASGPREQSAPRSQTVNPRG